MNSRHGIIDIHKFYNYNLTDLAQGNIIDVLNKRKHTSKSILDSSELLLIAEEAREAKYFSGYVDWLTVALEKATSENKSEQYTNRIKYV